MTLAERLVVSADFENESSAVAVQKTLQLANALQDTGVIIKSHTALRAYGYGLIDQIHDRGLKFFADLKLNDIPNTLRADGRFLHDKKPDLLTVMASSGEESMKALVQELPETEILAVTVLTSFSRMDATEIYGNMEVIEIVNHLAEIAYRSGVNGIVLSPQELDRIMMKKGFTYNTPGIRPSSCIIKNDDQSRCATPAEAIAAGATRIIIGRPITQSSDPRGAVEKILKEIQGGLKMFEDRV